VPAHGGRRFHRDPRRQYLSPFNVLRQIAAERLLARLRGETVCPRMVDVGFTVIPGGSI
ncbi:MAG: hypothetical protein E7K05_22885, partial [Serratia marcescens]|nr:hypothetical protein [Serratia marcescens]